MHQNTGFSSADGRADLWTDEGGGQAHGSAGERLAEANYIRRNPRVIRTEHFPSPPEPGCDLVQDQGNPRLIAEFPEALQVRRGVEPHSSRTLHDGLQNDRRQLGPVGLEQACEIGNVGFLERLFEATRGPLGKNVLRQASGKEVVHSVDRIADGHGREGVAVVAPLDRE